MSTARPACWRYDLAFVLLSLGLLALVFGDALTGRSLLAPLDVAAKFYPQYHWLEPHAGPIPKNHYLVDVFDHELPRQHAIYQALRRGEFPWWDPYTDYGRPLAAEAHTGGTDPLRMALYCVLPFELAYNWSKALSSFLFGLGAYLLLRRLRFPGWVGVGCALAYQFASNHFLFQTPLCVSSTFAYYGLLWWAWARFETGFSWGHFVAAALLCACALMAGNQQTHAFLALFMLCLLVGYGFKNRDAGKRLFCSMAGSSLLGCLIALPVVVAQIELFLLMVRSPVLPGAKLGWLAAVGAPVALFPWLTGTFRTLDFGRITGFNAIGFCLYIGSAALVLAGGGAALYATRKTATGALRAAVLLVLTYGVICLTPLRNVLYTRASDLAVLGLLLLSAYGANALASGLIDQRPRQVMTCLSLGCIIAFALANVLAFLVVPRLEGKLERYVLERDRENRSFPSVPEFRRFQVANLSREMSVRNPETIAAALGALGMLVLLRRRQQTDGREGLVLLQAVLALNVVPLTLFAHRFIVREPVGVWRTLLHEDSPQLQLAGELGLQYRLQDVGSRFERMYPGALPLLFGVHATHGYSSFPLPAIEGESQALGLQLVDADLSRSAPEHNSASGKPLLQPPVSGTSRFQWRGGLERQVKVVAESLNQVTIHVEAGPPGILVRTDRFYPGWHVSQPGDVAGQLLGHCLLGVQVPARELNLTFAYTPRFLSVTRPVSLSALASCLGLALWALSKRGQARAVNVQ